MPCAPLLVCKNLSFKGSKGQPLLDNVSFELKVDQKVAVVGPNGAGKSILLGLLSGRLKPASGQINLFGRAIEKISPMSRAQKIAVMLQSEYIEPLLSVEEYVSLGRIPYDKQMNAIENKAEIENAIQFCNLSKYRQQSIKTLSGGERQRASLARTIAQTPNLLFLDEPTNHLDLRAKVDILKCIRKLPVTSLAVIHELTLVEDFADRVIVLQNGKIVADGPPMESLSNETVQKVFKINRVDVVHPTSGKEIKVFEAFEL